MPLNYYSENETKDSNPDIYFMRQALLEAQKAAQRDEVPVGAVVVCQGRIIARGHNLTETLTDVTAHAEMQAFTIATDYLGGKSLQKCILYVTLEPCAMCCGASYWVQIGKIVYGASDTKRGVSKLHDQILHPTTEVVGGVLHEQCEELIQNFFKEKR